MLEVPAQVVLSRTPAGLREGAERGWSSGVVEGRFLSNEMDETGVVRNDTRTESRAEKTRH